MKKIIEARNIVKDFGSGNTITHVLKDISFEVEQGEFLSIMGPSGCGKSTLLYLLGGLDEPTSGIIMINGKNLKDQNDQELSRIRRQEIGFVFQFYNLVHNLTVEENILLPIVMAGKNPKEYEARLGEMLEIVGLQEKRKVIPSQLSGGQQQRVAIARAVMTNPSLILADEPIGNLDSVSGIRVMELFQAINRQYGITIVQVTHAPEMALYGTRVLRLKDGVVQADNKIIEEDRTIS
ncbi:MAG: ABC transporter ATP-binding protein [Tissierellia bacterium]|nr:ABC transporter ATP-binding protein [Tissierellia bacterium]